MSAPSMDFSIMAEGYEKMTKTTSRTELTSILVDILKATPPKILPQVAYLTQGKLFPDFVGIEIGMAEKTVSRAIEKAFGCDPSEIQKALRKSGDLGDVAAELSERKVQQLFKPEKLTVEKVYSTFEEIAKTTGSGSSGARINKLAMLLNSATPLEAKFLARFVTGKLRLGVADFTVLDALTIAFTGSKESRPRLEKAYNLTSDLGEVAKILSTRGLKGIDEVKVEASKPVRPMLAERMNSTESIIEQMNYNASCEYKLDGERVQAHKTSQGEIILFSRRLEKITSQYGDVVETLGRIPAKDFIVEGEIVAVDAKGKYLPFQELMHRRRKYEVEEAMKKYPVQVNLFDVLLLNGAEKIDEPYEKRRKLLEEIFASAKIGDEKIRLVPARLARTSKEMESMMTESLNAGCEGIVVKDLSSPYRAGARGYAWIKFKPEYRKEVRDTIDLVIVGANHGMGRRAGVYGAFLLATYDPKTDTFKTTTKVGTGFSDLDLEKITKMMSVHKIKHKSPRVDARVEAEDWFEPAVVLEIIASEITLSPIYTAGLDLIREGSGFALRFPKFTGRIRDDKAPEDATTVQELLEMYQKQSRQYRKAVEESSSDDQYLTS
ncbi:MAG TPA: ATP-dependent DNA ligase [Nitrososphaerales archaeon]|nr:ATP-dependent DNA ligase [Nitrososphaerales archaeon]